MPRSALLQASRRILTLTPASALDLGRSLQFTIEQQEQTNWCWAAVGLAIALRHDAGSAPAGQCDLAGRVQQIPGACCPAGTNADLCNNMRSFADTIENIGLPFDAAHASGGPIPFNRIVEMINAGCPIVAQIVWPNGFGHVVAIYGYQQLTDDNGVWNWLWIRDPLLGGDQRRILWQGTGDNQLRDEVGNLFGSWIFTFYPNL